MANVTGRSIPAPRIAELVQRVQSRASPVELIYCSHDRWPLPPPPPIPASASSERSSSTDLPADLQSGATANARAAAPGVHARTPIRISVLDSSFNPPTLAHLSLIRSLPPSPLNGRSNITSPEAVPPGNLLAGEQNAEDYNARLLMLSVRNADKSMKPGDANYIQRLEMMVMLAQVLQLESESGSPSAANLGNVAVAIIDEPTFINKSSVLRSFLEVHLSTLEDKGEIDNNLLVSRTSTQPGTRGIQLTFVMGLDTLERFFAPRYYAPLNRESSGEDAESIMLAMLEKFFAAPPIGDGSLVVCAHRSSVSTTALQTAVNDVADGKMTSLVQKFQANHLVSFINLPESAAALSSSEVRTRISSGTSWKHMLAHRIAIYIEEQALYSTDARVMG